MECVVGKYDLLFFWNVAILVGSLEVTLSYDKIIVNVKSKYWGETNSRCDYRS